MRICFIVPSLVNCGPINVVRSLCKSFYKFEHDICIIYLYERCDELIVKEIIDYCRLGIFHIDDFDYLNNLKDFDIVHSHGFYPDRFLKKNDINGKKISTLHCMFYKDYPKEYGFLKGYIGAYLHFDDLKKGCFHSIVACSKSVKDYASNFLPSSVNLLKVNNGVDHSIFFPLNKEQKISIRSLMGFSSYKKIFIYSGRLIRRKRVPELMDIFNSIYSKDNVLIVLGDGEEMSVCKDKKLSNVLFMGEVENPEVYYQISDFIISNSSAEGYPMSIIEAVSCGCKALLSDIPPHREFIQENPSVANLFGKDINLKDFNFSEVHNLSSDMMALKYLEIYKS